MLRLGAPAEVRWVDLVAGVRVQVRPIDTGLVMRVRHSVAAQAAEGWGDRDPEVESSLLYAEHSIVAWEGVGDADGEPVEPTPARVRQLLSEQVLIFDAFRARVLGPAFMVAAEGNGFAPSPSGTSAGATSTARTAKGRARSARRG